MTLFRATTDANSLAESISYDLTTDIITVENLSSSIHFSDSTVESFVTTIESKMIIGRPYTIYINSTLGNLLVGYDTELYGTGVYLSGYVFRAILGAKLNSMGEKNIFTIFIRTNNISSLDVNAIPTIDYIMTGATSAAAGSRGLVPTPAAGNQAAFLRGDATWAVPTNTWNALKAATSAANGTAGYVVAPTSANYANRTLMYLRSDATWQYLPLQNNVTTTAAYYALDARQGKVLNDKINLVGDVVTMAWTSYTATTAWTKQTSKSLALTAGTWLINTYARSGNTANTFQVSMGTTAYNAGNNSATAAVTIPRKVDGRDAQGASVFLTTLTAATTYYPYIICGTGTGTNFYVKADAIRLN